MPAARFLLIRHAATDAIGKTITGRLSGVRLNEAGRREAHSLVASLSEVRVTAIFSSPLERAVETARPLAEARRLEVNLADELLELDFGLWSGEAIDALDGRPEWQRFNNFRSSVPIPGGETMLEVQSRVVRLLDRLRERFTGESTALVTHGDVVRAAVAHYGGMPLELMTRLEVLPASITALDLYPDSARILFINWKTPLALA